MEDFGFKKIDVTNTTIDPKNASLSQDPQKQKQERENAKSAFLFKKFGVVGFVLILIIALFGFASVRALTVYKDYKKASGQAKTAFDAIKKQNIVKASDELVKTQDSINVLKKDIDSFSFLSFLPPLSYYFQDLKHLVNASSHGVKAAIITSDSLIPYADVLGLKGEKSFVMGSAEDRIRITVKTMSKVVPKIDDIEKEIEQAKQEVDKVNPERYPNFLVFKRVRSRIEEVKSAVDQGALAVERGKPLIKVLPELLGEKEAKKYLILFQNDKELRPTGGFLTFYSIFRVEEGVIHVDSSSDIYDLDDSIPYHPAPPPVIAKYLPKVGRFYIRDSNLSPDFAESMKTFNQFFEKSSRKQKIDGIIGIDTHVLVHVLDILGGVQASGITYTSKIDKRCSCPQVVYMLESFADQPIGDFRSGRKAVIGDLLYAIMQKALSSSPKLYWGRLFQQGISDISEKHILFALNNSQAQKGVESLNWAGKIRDFEGDYLHINDANFGGAKSNMYVKQKVRIDYKVGNDGEITKTVSISYKNPEPHSDCDLERGGLCLNATLRNYQRVLVSEGSVLSSSKGSEVKVETSTDIGKTVFESFFTVKPLGKSEIIYTYKLPLKLKNNELPLLIQKQPGIDKVPYEIFVNGKKVESFDLVADKQLTLRF